VAAEASPAPEQTAQSTSPGAGAAAEVVPAKAATRQFSASPVVLAGVVALAGILGIVVITRRQRQGSGGAVDRTEH
jgi:uncharacterized membrane protein YebE (DUF533 family)